MKERLTMYGCVLPFTVKRNVNKVKQYPGPDGPALDIYTCEDCGGQLQHTMDGAFMMGGDTPEDTLFKALKRHIVLCRLVTEPRP